MRLRELLVTLLVTTGCTKYGVPLPPPEPEPAVPAQVTLTQSPELVEKVLRGYLALRGRLESETERRSLPNGRTEIRFTQPWIRDTSLLYYSLEFDRRARHAVAWKGEWRLSGMPGGSSTLRLDILEVLYLGPARLAGGEPRLNSSWFETDADALRPGLELRRFLNDFFPNDVPKYLAVLSVPSLAGPPKGKDLLTPAWQPLKRPRAF